VIDDDPGSARLDVAIPDKTRFSLWSLPLAGKKVCGSPNSFIRCDYSRRHHGRIGMVGPYLTNSKQIRAGGNSRHHGHYRRQRAMGRDLGASNYFGFKPVDRERLVTLIEKHRAMRFSTAANWCAPSHLAI